MAKQTPSPGLVALVAQVKATAKDRRSRPRAAICLAVRRLAREQRPGARPSPATVKTSIPGNEKRVEAPCLDPLPGSLRRR